MCLALVEPKAPGYHAYMCVHNLGFFRILFLDFEIQGYLHSLSPIKNTYKQVIPTKSGEYVTNRNKERTCLNRSRKNLLSKLLRQRGSLKLAFLQLIKNSKSQKNLKSCQLLQNSAIIHVSSSMVTINEALEADEYME